MSAESQRFNQIQRDYIKLLQDSVERWDSALDDLLHRRTSVSRMAADTVATWLDVAKFSLAVWTKAPTPQTTTPAQSQPEPVQVSFKLKKGAATAHASKVVNLPADAQLTPTSLTRTDAIEGQIPAANVEAHVDDDGRVLVVQLVELKDVPAGEYRGTINDRGGTPVASIKVAVE
ncbi:MAG TPA: hypothetical protein VMT89_06915 [Candidatus Acidoferrales bacterium]|nr:hypothetical protein [Candidatus Acidoferrales bacterium]